MRISDWSSDVCSSDLGSRLGGLYRPARHRGAQRTGHGHLFPPAPRRWAEHDRDGAPRRRTAPASRPDDRQHHGLRPSAAARSEEHTSELQSLMRISYAVFCLKKKKHTTKNNTTNVTPA